MAVVGNTKDIAMRDICAIISNIYKSEGVDGITISGGDPMEQLPKLVDLLENLHTYTDDVLVYIGYVWPHFSQYLSDDVKNKSDWSKCAVSFNNKHIFEIRRISKLYALLSKATVNFVFNLINGNNAVR